MSVSVIGSSRIGGSMNCRLAALATRVASVRGMSVTNVVSRNMKGAGGRQHLQPAHQQRLKRDLGVAERRAALRAAEHPPLHRGGRLHLRRLRSDPQLVHQAEAAQDLTHRRNARNGPTGESNTVDGTSCEVPAGRRNPEELTPPGS